MKNSNSSLQALNPEAFEKRYRCLSEIMNHILSLYTFNESSVIPLYTGQSLLESVTYVLGIESLEDEKACILETDNPLALFRKKQQELESRIDNALVLWETICVTMPPLNNIALRDTLVSIGDLKRKYDIYFAAHEIPCNIDYPLYKPVSEQLKGIDYIQAWLEQLYREVCFLSRFEVQDCISVLESWCPDYKGLLINMYEPLFDAWQKGSISYKK